MRAPLPLGVPGRAQTQLGEEAQSSVQREVGTEEVDLSSLLMGRVVLHVYKASSVPGAKGRPEDQVSTKL